MSDAFYVGYLAPNPETARRLKRYGAALVVLAAVVATALAIATGPFDRATYEYGLDREWEGTIEIAPNPVLVTVTRAVPNSPLGTYERFPLVAEGKHGADAMFAGLEDATVRFKGRRIMRQATTMLEVVPGTIERVEEPIHHRAKATPASDIEDLGTKTFSGEIVDSKCFLGVMNPGRLEVHRACAIRCIAGGVPPMLYVREHDGREAHLLLVDDKGLPINDRVLDLVGVPVTIEGRLERRDDLYYLYAAKWGRSN
jgi:hypothetical protein